MAISINIPMFDMTDSKLSKSADSLESALAQCKSPFSVYLDKNLAFFPFR